MAKKPPPLPESDDPFVVLGLAPDADERAVRKASVRLNKLYRPRKAPADFDRLQAAIRRALWLVELRDREQRIGVTGARLLPDTTEIVPDLDRPVASAEECSAWSAAFAEHLGHDVAAARSMLAEPALLGDAQRDPTWACAALNAIAALAWRDAGADEARRRLKLPSDRSVADLAALVDVDLDGGRVYRAWHRPILLPGLMETVGDGRLVDAAGKRERLATLDDQLRENPADALTHFDTLAERCPQLVEPLARRLLEEVPADRRELRELPAERVTALASGLRDVSSHAPIVLTAAAGLGAVVVCGLGAIGGGVGGGGILAGSAMWGVYSLDTRQYRKAVRPRLARVIVDGGVTRAVTRQWLEANRRRALRLARFGYQIGLDKPMLLLGMAAAAAASTRP